MQVGIVHGERVSRALWKALPAEMKLCLLANQQVQIDDEGRPIVADEMLATTLRDVEAAMGLR